MDNNKNKEKKKKSQRTGTAIIRVAAFAFAVVSCYATAEGLSLYVFDSGWQSVCISFGIQSILFVLNLKLPAYINRIGENAVDREKKKYWIGAKRGQEKNTYKATAGQKILCGFYLVVLLSSSFFSFVYICNHVVYEHQSGYVDDNIILSSEYRRILNDTDNYITEYTKATQILASKLLGELKEAYPVVPASDEAVSLEELNDKVSEAQDACDIAEEEYAMAKEDVKAAKDEMDGYQASRNNTTWHDRQDEWQKKFDAAKSVYENSKKIRDQKKEEYDSAKTALTEAKKAAKNYKKSQDTVIAEFLLEMLNPSPTTEDLEKDINELNAMIIELGEGDSIVDNYSDLVGKTQTITVVVKDYITLMSAAGTKSESSIEYLLAHVMDNVTAPDPSLESFEDDCISWRKGWETKLNTLENVIQHLPKFSENEKAYLTDGLIDVDLLSSYVANEKMDKIDELRRSKISDINVIEKAASLLTGKYKFTALFSFGLAVFFDVCSLLVGLFLYWIQKKEANKK